MACFCTLASGSSGNSTYMASGTTGVLIDVGISCRSVFAALEQCQIDPYGIEAVFITHEHADHIKGLKNLLKKLQVPVYATEEVLGFLADHDCLPDNARAHAMPAQGLQVGDLYIGGFETSHDSVHSVGYAAVSGTGASMAVATDLGVVTDVVRRAVCGCDLVLLESNYDRGMLMSGSYPYPLKHRIDSRLGHLSNDDCVAFLLEIAKSGAKDIILGHLSQENNLPELALKSAVDALKQIGLDKRCRVHIAPRYVPGELIRL